MAQAYVYPDFPQFGKLVLALRMGRKVQVFADGKIVQNGYAEVCGGIHGDKWAEPWQAFVKVANGLVVYDDVSKTFAVPYKVTRDKKVKPKREAFRAHCREGIAIGALPYNVQAVVETASTDD